MLAEYLKALRKARGVSQTDWARRSGVSRATLHRWERGDTVPRDVELDAALSALAASADERRTALHGLALARDGHGIERIAPLGGIPLIRGELLRALRLRAGWTRERAAAAAGVSLSAVTHWEIGDNWPQTDRLHRLCLLYNALPTEVAALTTLPALESEVSGDPLQAVRLDIGTYASDWRLLDLTFLTRLAQIAAHSDAAHTHAAHPYAARLRAELHLEYAQILLVAGRYEEVRRELRFAAHGSALTTDRLRVLYATLAATAAWYRDTAHDKADAIARLHAALHRATHIEVAPFAQAWSLLTTFLHDSGRAEVAESGRSFLALEKQARTPGQWALLERLRPRVLSDMGDHEAGLRACAAIPATTPALRTFGALQRAEIAESAGSRAEATAAYEEARRHAGEAGIESIVQTCAAKLGG